MSSLNTDVTESPDMMTKFRSLSKQLEETNAKVGVKDEPAYGDDCDHDPVVTGDAGIPFCTDCGLEFPNRRVYSRGYDEYRQFIPHFDDRLGRMTLIEETTEPEPKPALANKRGRPKGPKNEPKPKPPRDESPPPTNPRNVKDLRKIARHRGLKYHTTMSKKDLCEALGVELIKPIKYLFTDKETGEEHGFHTIYKALKDMGVNPGFVKYYLGRDITIEGKTYTLTLLDG